MAPRKARGDARLTVARYRIDHLSGQPDDDAGTDPSDTADEPDTAGQTTMEHVTQFVEISLQQAMRRGDFDNLPGTGKPLSNLAETYDPDWWIRRKIEREQLTGLGPPALTLRTEDERLDARLDREASERAVREIVDDFNRRVIDARRQLLGGPPVITRTRDADIEVVAWRERRDARIRELQQRREREAAAAAPLSWRQRRRARKAGSGESGP